MLARKGRKSDRTIMMENAISTWFEKAFSIELLPEHRVKTGGIADFLGFMGDEKSPQEVIIVEIKQIAQDFYSGHGLNFVGTSNYLAVPSELVGVAIEFLRDDQMDYVGVLEVTDDAFVRLVTYPRLLRPNAYIGIYPLQVLCTPPHMRDSILAAPKYMKQYMQHKEREQ